jgi:hypothetical protein
MRDRARWLGDIAASHNKYYNNNEMVEEKGGEERQQLEGRGGVGDGLHIIHTSTATART